MSFSASSLPPVRGSSNDTPAYLFSYSIDNTATHQMVLCQIFLSGYEFSSIYCFSPCFTAKDKVLHYDLDNSENVVTQINIVEQNQIYNVSGTILPIAFSTSYVGSDDYQFLFPSGALTTTINPLDQYPPATSTTSDPAGDRLILYASFPYQFVPDVDITKRIYSLQPGNIIPGTKTNYSFNYLATVANVAQASLVSGFTGYFIPVSYFVQSTICPLTTSKISALQIVYQWSQTTPQNLTCDPGKIVTANQDCGWRDPYFCASGYFFDYCEKGTQCGTCYGPCDNRNPCLLNTSANPVSFTCDTPPSPPPPPEPAPSKNVTFWQKYGRSIILTSIIMGVFIFLAIFVGWIIPKNPPAENKINIIRPQTPQPPEIAEF